MRMYRLRDFEHFVTGWRHCIGGIRRYSIVGRRMWLGQALKVCSLCFLWAAQAGTFPHPVPAAIPATRSATCNPIQYNSNKYNFKKCVNVHSTSKWEERENMKKKITCSREKQGAVVTSLKIPQFHRPDDPLNISTIIVPHSRVMSWLCSPGQSRKLSWNSVCDTEPQHILSINYSRRPRRASDIREVRILALHLVNLTLVLALQAVFARPQPNQSSALPSWFASSV